MRLTVQSSVRILALLCCLQVISCCLQCEPPLWKAIEPTVLEIIESHKVEGADTDLTRKLSEVWQDRKVSYHEEQYNVSCPRPACMLEIQLEDRVVYSCCPCPVLSY